MLNIVIPMAGAGLRFRQQGYAPPKPLIEIKGSAMIALVIGNVRPREAHRFFFICRKEHCRDYHIQSLLTRLAPGCEIIVMDTPTEGAACTALLAKKHIDTADELVIVNSDQYIEADINAYLEDARTRKLDGAIMTFSASDPKWSFIRRDSDGLVVEVAEKKPISGEATVGIYYFREGRDFVNGAQAMVLKEARVNNEFYVCPVYNELLQARKKIGAWEIPASQMHGLGTPEDVAAFHNSTAFARL